MYDLKAYTPTQGVKSAFSRCKDLFIYSVMPLIPPY